MVKFPHDKFLPPVHKFNDSVGPLFSELRDRFPLDDHHDSGLQRSLGIFLNYCFTEAMGKMEELRPTPLSREDWMKATPEEKEVHMLWQQNLAYLRRRIKALGDNLRDPNPRPQTKKSRFDDFEVGEYDVI